MLGEFEQLPKSVRKIQHSVSSAYFEWMAHAWLQQARKFTPSWIQAWNFTGSATWRRAKATGAAGADAPDDPQWLGQDAEVRASRPGVCGAATSCSAKSHLEMR